MGWIQQLKDMLLREESAGLTELQCPRCQVQLRESKLWEFGRATLDVCPRCYGLWLDKGELDRLDGSVWSNVEEHHFHDVEGDHLSSVCPKCLTELDPVSATDYSNVIVDRCPKCAGFWLDHGELDRMKDVAAVTDSTDSHAADGQKPAGWSDLRWQIVQLKQTRD